MDSLSNAYVTWQELTDTLWMVIVAIRLCSCCRCFLLHMCISYHYIPCICTGSSLFMKSIYIENAKTYMLKNWVVLKEKSGLFKQKACETVSSTYVYYIESWLWCFFNIREFAGLWLCSWMFVSEPKVCRYKSHSYMQLEWKTDKKTIKVL